MYGAYAIWLWSQAYRRFPGDDYMAPEYYRILLRGVEVRYSIG